MRLVPFALPVLAVVVACASTPTATPPPAADPWAPVDSVMRQTIAAGTVPGAALVVHDAQHRVVFRRSYGDFAADRRVPVASASKLIAGLVLFDLIGRGRLSLESTTAQVLGWTGVRGTITLRHLLSFTSGLAPIAACTFDAGATLAECVDRIRLAPVNAAPGQRFDYGSTHLHVAARMAEVASGRTWNVLFRETLATPLGLSTEVTFFTIPRQAMGTGNPLVAGGLRASTDEYMQLLAVASARGQYRGLSIGTGALYDQQMREPFPAVDIGFTPIDPVTLGWRYGFTAWLECATPATGCTTVSSPGAFGFTPWIDRANGYYASLGMELSRADGGVAATSVAIASRLKPALVAALRAAR
ncbi:MAG: beta-lactamase family protein [Gemmatimonadaceae bacterium]|jgi:CubicO group peptidase (beta-lactamase class C family)|nr:beta-lactamase family protein [Gemmatimonadaceae bacterium]